MSLARTSPGKIRNAATSKIGIAFSVAAMPTRDARRVSGYPQRLVPCDVRIFRGRCGVAASAGGARADAYMRRSGEWQLTRQLQRPLSGAMYAATRSRHSARSNPVVQRFRSAARSFMRVRVERRVGLHERGNSLRNFVLIVGPSEL